MNGGIVRLTCGIDGLIGEARVTHEGCRHVKRRDDGAREGPPDEKQRYHAADRRDAVRRDRAFVTKCHGLERREVLRGPRARDEGPSEIADPADGHVKPENRSDPGEHPADIDDEVGEFFKHATPPPGP